MTIGTKMHHTLANLEGAASDSQDQTAKKMFNDLNRQLEDIVQALKGRVNYVEKQEPQYKMNQNL